MNHSSRTVETSSKLSEAFPNSVEVAVCVACACGGVKRLLITDGESRATKVFRVVPLLVVDDNIGTFPSRGLPMMDGLQRTISIPSKLTNKAMLLGMSCQFSCTGNRLARNSLSLVIVL
jgi:hypothetical protein